MSNLLKFLVILVAAVIVGGGAFLATWDIPAPTHQVETVLDDSQFPR
ncbi:hypothetical protein [Aestuariispira ectoiniformans]|nr:hypothetical protein [Aestuariispira ectoiniformans]